MDRDRIRCKSSRKEVKMTDRKMLPVGIDSFEKIRKEGFYYADKTELISDILHSWSEVTLFTRPRRFGKSLNMSMLKYFFEVGADRSLFDGLKISNEQDLCEKYMGQFPVISLSLKGVDGMTFEEAKSSCKSVIGEEASRFRFLLESECLSEEDKTAYRRLIEIATSGKDMYAMPDELLQQSLRTLSRLLACHYHKKVILLIDEYDVPLDKAFQHGYYDQMVLLIRNMFGNALKTNPDLQFAVLTGCLRIAKESIFTGLNNFKVMSITDIQFDEHFGFTEREVKEMLAYYDLLDHAEEMKEWYDGYRFGNCDVYCPWDVINYCSALLANPAAKPQSFWMNSSGNDMLNRFIDSCGKEKMLTKRELEQLVNGGSVQKEIRQDLTYRDLYTTMDNLWSTLFMTGYLTYRGEPDGNRLNLVIPNLEIRDIVTQRILSRFQQEVYHDGEMAESFCRALEEGRPDEVERIFTEYMKKTLSIRDTFARKATKENFYHGILLGIVSYKSDWLVRSNRESGNGYSDIMIETGDPEKGIILEIKYAQDGDEEKACLGALRQIEEKHYAQALEEEGITKILKYGIACNVKRCRVEMGG